MWVTLRRNLEVAWTSPYSHCSSLPSGGAAGSGSGVLRVVNEMIFVEAAAGTTGFFVEAASGATELGSVEAATGATGVVLSFQRLACS